MSATTAATPLPNRPLHPTDGARGREPRARRRHLEPRTRLVLTAALVVLALLLNGGRAADAAHAVCTAGEPSHVTCGESLVRLGYP